MTRSDGQFTWRPGENDGGKTHDVTIRVEATARGEPYSGRHTYQIHVEEVNQGPNFLQPPDRLTASPGEPLGQTFTAEDPDVHADGSKDKLTWKLLSGDFPGRSWDGDTGTLTWTPDPSYDGPPITGVVAVEDESGERATFEFTVEVRR